MQGIRSDNVTISVFLYQMRKQAEERGVHLECFVERPFPEYPIPEKDLIGLLGNALNNAFDGVAPLEPDRRNVFLSMQTRCIEVVNNLAVIRDVDYGISTKGDGRGYGRLNMKRIADRNGMKLSFMTEDGRYIVNMRF